MTRFRRSRGRVGPLHHFAEALEPRVLLTATQLADINSSTDTSDPNWMTVWNGEIYFSADDGIHGRELWRSDGTEAGTRLVADLAPGRDSSYPSHLTAAEGKLFFTTTGGEINGQIDRTGGGIWVTDGTAAGTKRISTVKALDSSPFRGVGGRLYFTIDSSAAGYGLWTSDGTTDGTHSLNGPIYSHVYTDLDGIAYFTGQDTEHGLELWRTDGTVEGTRLVRDVVPGSGHGVRGGAVAYQGAVYFAAKTGLWKTDGSEQGTVRVFGSTDIEALKVVGDRLYFQGMDEQVIRRLYVTDGTTEGTRRVTTVGIYSAYPVYELNGSVYLWSDRLYRLDNSADGVEPVTQDLIPSPIEAFEAGGYLYFVTTLSQSRIGDLWRTDGTAAGTVKLVVDNGSISYNSKLNFVKLGDSVYFNLGEPYFVRGGSDDIQLLSDINRVAPFGSNPTSFTTAGNNTYFLTHGHVWRTDGTPQGTIEIFDSGVRDFDRDFWRSAAVGSSLVFNLGNKVWFVGPTPGSQKLLMTFADRYSGGPLVAWGSKVYFMGQTDVFDKRRVWVYDTASGDAAPRQVLGDFGEAYDPLYASDDRVYFTANPEINAEGEPWVIDPATDQAQLLKDIRPGDAGSSPQFLTHVGSTVYFSAFDETGKRRLWKTNGTEAGTSPIAGAPEPAPSFGSQPEYASTGKNLYLAARGAGVTTNDYELWEIALDGSDLSRRVKDLTPGPVGTILSRLTAVGDLLFFSAAGQLFVTDGTEEGTRQLSTTLIGSEVRGPVDLTRAGDLLYFLGDDGVRGMELWRSDGTPEGTVVVADLNPRGNGFYLDRFPTPGNSTLAALGDRVVFAGDDAVRGLEPWIAGDDGEPLVDIGEPYATAEGQSVTVSANSGPGVGGSPIELIEWDFDYEMSKGEFIADATGAVTSYFGRDGFAVHYIAARVTDAAGRSRIDTTRVAVANVRPMLTLSGADTVEEGSPYTVRFAASDPGADAVKTWVVRGSDGADQVLPGSADSATLVFSDGPTGRAVEVRAIDEDGTYVAQIIVQIANVAPHDVDLGPDREADEGSAVLFQGKFVDPGANDRWTYRWSVYDALGAVAAEGIQKDFSFTSADPGDYRVEFMVRDKDGAIGSDEVNLHINNLPPKINLGGARTFNEGQSITFNPIIADPGGGVVASVRWKVMSDFGWSTEGIGAPFSFVPPDDGRYEVVISATDAEGLSTDKLAIVTVLDVPPTLNVAGPTATFNDAPLALMLGAVDPGTDLIDHWTIDWGDGAVETIPGDATSAAHQYTQVGDFKIAVGATDEHGAHAAPQRLVAVRDRPFVDAVGVVNVRGTAGDNTIQITTVDGAIRIVIDGATSEFPASAVQRVAVDGLAGADLMIVSGGPGDDEIRVENSFIWLTNQAVQVPIDFLNLETLRIEGSDGNDRIELNAGSFPAPPLTIVGGMGEDSLVVDDQLNMAGREFSIDDDHSLGWTGISAVHHEGVEHLAIHAGAGPDAFRVEPDANADLTIVASDPSAAAAVADRLALIYPPRAGGRRVLTADDAGEFTFANRRPIHYEGIEAYEGPDLVWPQIVAARYFGKQFEVDFSKEMAPISMRDSLTALNLDTRQLLTGDIYGLPIDPARPRTLRWSMQYELPTGHYRGILNHIVDLNDNPVADPQTFDFSGRSIQVLGRQLLYGVAPNELRVAPDKRALLEGETPSFSNITSAPEGITGITVTYGGYFGSSSDFEFKFEVIRNGVATPIYPYGGETSSPQGQDRRSFWWAPGSIKNAWLRVTVKHYGQPTFERPEVFYFGSLVGETGDATSPIAVTASDLVRLRNAIGRRAELDDPFDIDRNGVVNASDLVVLRNNIGRSLPPPFPRTPAAIFAPSPVRTPAAADLLETRRNEDDPGDLL